MRVRRSREQGLQVCIGDSTAEVEVGQIDQVALRRIEIGDGDVTAAEHKRVGATVSREGIGSVVMSAAAVEHVVIVVANQRVVELRALEIEMTACYLETKTKVSPDASPVFNPGLSRFTVTPAVACS